MSGIQEMISTEVTDNKLDTAFCPVTASRTAGTAILHDAAMDLLIAWPSLRPRVGVAVVIRTTSKQNDKHQRAHLIFHEANVLG